MTFHQYLGLKYELGADPKDGKAADCSILCLTLLREAGVKVPDFDPKWTEMARMGLWGSLETIWRRETAPISEPEQFSVAMHRNRPRPGSSRLGIVTAMESSGSLGIVMIHARKGVIWLPLSTPGLPKFQFRKFK